MPKWMSVNNLLRVIAGVAAAAATVAAVPLGLPSVVVAVATKIALYGSTAGIIAAKILPGHGANAPEGDLKIPSDKVKPGAT